MTGEYIIDAFLSFWLWAILSLVYVGVMDNLKALDGSISQSLFEVAIERFLKPSIIASLPLWAVFGFLLWRFCALLITARMWGSGAIGLAMILGLAGVVLIWLRVLLLFVSHSNFTTTSRKIEQVKQAKKQAETDVFGRAVG